MKNQVLILTDGKAGHENQAKAFVRSLGCEYVVMEVHFKSKFHKAISYLLDHLNIYSTSLFYYHLPEPVRLVSSLIFTGSGISSSSFSHPLPESVDTCLSLHSPDSGSSSFSYPLPEPVDTYLSLLSPGSGFFSSSTKTSLPKPAFSVVIGAGSGVFYPAKTIAHRLKVKCGVVLYPRGYLLKTFDCILAPSFDCPARANNIIEIPANLVANDELFYTHGIEEFQKRYTGSTDSLIAVIIGGPNKCSTMDYEWLKGELDRIFRNEKGQLCVTTSRRTPKEIEALVDTYPWDYKLIYSRDQFNPIPAFVKLAKKLYVTAESTGMLSEACTFGSAEVYALDNLKRGKHKFRRFVDGLTMMGCLGGNRKVCLSAAMERAKQLLSA